METRKVQITGGSSYIISLPKEWINKNKIHPKDALNLIIQEDKILLIPPKKFKKLNFREKVINLEDIEGASYLFRLLIGVYMMGYSMIILQAKKRITIEYREVIKKFVNDAIGLEIMDESPYQIKIKDLLNPAEMPFDTITNRLYLLVKNMLDDSRIALNNKDKDLSENIVKRDDDIDRLYWLIARQSNLILKNLIISIEVGIETKNANFYYFISRIIERIGDHAVNIAKHIPIIMERLKEPQINKINTAIQAASDIFSKSIKIWQEENMTEANQIIDSAGNLNSILNEINNFAINTENEVAIALNYIIESIRRIADYSTNICELTIN
ncbi:MAG: PhoU domain-containing protein, partial [Candidatus Helarchaeota archaeon]